jgi:putative glutamine amidotransferase
LQPLIGITTGHYINTSDREITGAHPSYIRAVAQAGGLPVLIPYGLGLEITRAIYERVDAVLIIGGGDIDPAYYGEAAHPTTAIDPNRDEYDLNLARWAYDDDLPLFGICRGHQVVNVALGGTLVQDIPSETGSPVPHDVPGEYPNGSRTHRVRLDPGSHLASILGKTELDVNSYHHQSVEKPAPNAIITAHSEDGVVEALELPGRKFALSVQWHPELMVDQDEDARVLFRAFVDAARQRAEAR